MSSRRKKRKPLGQQKTLYERRAGHRRPEKLNKRLEYCTSMLYIFGAINEADKDRVKKRINRLAGVAT